MLFVFGVGMAVLGVALCLVGSVRLPGGRVLRARDAQICGIILLWFFPLVFLLQPLVDDWEQQLVQAIYSGLALLCFAVVAVVVLVTTRPALPARKSAPAVSLVASPLVDEPALPNIAEAQPQGPGSLAQCEDPFDFSP